MEKETYKIVLPVSAMIIVGFLVIYFSVTISPTNKPSVPVEKGTISADERITVIPPSGDVTDMINGLLVYSDEEKNQYKQEISEAFVDVGAGEIMNLAQSNNNENF